MHCNKFRSLPSTIQKTSMAKHLISSAATSATNTSSKATLETNPHPIDLAREPLMQTFESKLAVLKTNHHSTNACIDELDANINKRMDSLDSSIQSLVLTSNTNFGLLLFQFNVSPSPTVDPLTTEITIGPKHSPTEEMDVDINSFKHEWAPCSGTACQQGKK